MKYNKIKYSKEKASTLELDKTVNQKEKNRREGTETDPL